MSTNVDMRVFSAS